MSLTSLTQNKINKKSSKSKNSSQSKIKKLKNLSNIGGGDSDQISRENESIKNVKLQKSISVLAKALAKGFFAEVNCKILTDDFCNQLASHVQTFLVKEGLQNLIFLFC